MPTENQNHPDDHAAIERLHQQYVGKIERFSDDLMAFQDAAYAMGLERGKLLEAKRAEALQQRLTAADERADSAITFVTRLIECAGGQPSIATGYLRDILDTLKPAEPAKEEHVCTGCGSKGWTANCKECVPY